MFFIYVQILQTSVANFSSAYGHNNLKKIELNPQNLPGSNPE